MTFDDEISAFLGSGVSIAVVSRNAAMLPSVDRAKGCRVLREPQSKLRIFISSTQAPDLLANIRATATISVTFSVPNTLRTLQLKGGDARIDALRDEDRATIDAYLPAFEAAILPLGFSAEFTHTLFSSSHDDVAIEFSPTDAFQQTPGSAAGARL